MSLRPVFADIVLPSLLRAAGTFASGPVSNPGQANIVEFFIAVTAVGGSTQTIDAVVQTSPDNVTYTSVTSSAITQMTAVGIAHSFAFASTALYAQILVTVGGTGTPTATCAVGVMVL